MKKGDRIAVIMRNLPEWPVAFWAGRMNSRLVPMAVKRAVRNFWKPEPMASMAMTAPTPMMMPSMARTDRILFAHRLLRALMMVVQRSMA